MDGINGVSSSYSSFVPSRNSAKSRSITNNCLYCRQTAHSGIRCQNLRFAQLVCAAQKLSGQISVEVMPRSQELDFYVIQRIGAPHKLNEIGANEAAKMSASALTSPLVQDAADVRVAGVA
jgi:hypothetical protein